MDSSEALTVLVAAMVVLSILGVAANTTVCVVMFRSKRIWRNPSSFLVSHLSIADLLFRLVVVPLHILCLTYTPGLDDSGALFLATQFAGFNYATIIFVTLALIALERYTSIAHPLKHLQRTTRKRGFAIVVVFIWTYSLVVTTVVWGVFEVASSSDSSYNASLHVSAVNITSCDRKIVLCGVRSNVNSKTNHWSTILTAALYLSFGVLFPVVTTVILYVRITGILWRRSRAGTIHGRVARSVRKSLRMLVIIVCGFLFCWIPSIIIRPLLVLRVASCETELVLIMTAQLTQNSSSIINPIIYAVYSKDFFNDYRKFCCTCSTCEKPHGITGLNLRKVRKVAIISNS